MKAYKKAIIVTSLVTLLPILWGLLLWNRLPMALTTHWNAYGQADRTSSRGFVVFGMPLVLLAFQWFCIIATALDSKNRNKNRKPLTLMLWVIPILSNVVIGIMYAVSLGKEVSPVGVILVFVGILLAAIGNYLPKCKQNSTLGLRIYWTLRSEENWNATHRFAGKVWVAGGLIMLLLAFLPNTIQCWAMLADILVLIALTTLYSYRYSLREKAPAEKPEG